MLVDISRDIQLGRYCKPKNLLFDVNMQERNQRAFERASENLAKCAKQEALWEQALSRQRQIRAGVLISTADDEPFAKGKVTLQSLEESLAKAAEKVTDAMTVSAFQH